MNKKALILIPARYASSRFPGKAIAPILEKPMIIWVYEGARNIINDFHDSKVVIVTDDQRVEDTCKEWNAEVVRVDDEVTSGSERIFLAYERYFKDQGFDLIINVQGDEPLIKSDVLKHLIHFHQDSTFDTATVVKEMTDKEQKSDPNKVKAIFSKSLGKCHYFTRAAVPFDRDNKGGLPWYLHVGIYSFRPKALEKFTQLDESLNEKYECLEQLRILDNGMSMGAIISDIQLVGGDTPKDIKFVEEVMNGK